VLLYTSGTEGEPKAAMLSHRALMANHEQVERITPSVVGSDDVILLSLPLFHAYGLNSGLGAVAYHGATGVLVERFDPADALGIIARHHVTALLGVPSMYVGWSLLTDGGWSVGEAMTSVRVAICGAAPLSPASAGRFTEATRHPVFVGYGLTETAPVLTSTLASPLPKAGSIGRPIPGVELRLVNPDGTVVWRNGQADAADADADADEDDFDLDLPSAGADPGEIVVRGANLFSGYWPDGRGGPDADGWWATGDIAYADADGDLFLVDRLGELILVSGFNVYPHEVEQVLSAHPGVAEAAVIGLPHPYTGQAVKAYVVRASGSQITAEEVLGHCERNLARFKCPTAVEFVDRLPHSATGKVRKTLLRSEADDG
jgi:long-chain acyl-CoA synthetase